MAHHYDILIVGAGVCGAAAAVELRTRGYNVGLLDPGPLPHPLASSTDISKAVRMAYGADEAYMEMGEQSREGWLRWNDEFGDGTVSRDRHGLFHAHADGSRTALSTKVTNCCSSAVTSRNA